MFFVKLFSPRSGVVSSLPLFSVEGGTSYRTTDSTESNGRPPHTSGDAGSPPDSTLWDPFPNLLHPFGHKDDFLFVSGTGVVISV